MKKLILPIIFAITFLLLLPQKTYSQTGQECMKIFDKEMKDCSIEFNACSDACQKETKKPDGTAYFNSGEIYPKCMKASNCQGKRSTCNEQALTNYRACGKSDKDSVEAKKEDLKQDQNQQSNNSPAPVWFADKMPIFTGDWLDVFSTGHGLLSFLYDTTTIVSKSFVEGDKQEVKEEGEARDYIYSLSDDYIKNVTGRGKEEILGRQPSIGDEVIKQLKQPAEGSPFRLDVLKGQAEIKYPGSNTWAPLKVGDKIPPGATIFTGMDASTVLSIKDKGVIQILPFTQIVVSEEGLDRAVQEKKTTTDIKLNMGDIEVSIPGGVFTGTLQITTPSSTTSIRGTHFWVTHNKDKNATTVGVYKGKVEVKPTGGKGPINIIPDKEGPGILVISQKLSPIKLGISGLVLLAIIGGITYFLRKRFFKKRINKKK